ncbi:hypothetical protein Xen7305DRAFT_00045070 [Xenococcus sp. PCC 7305]|uniref:hypothetical protein n=1 Tax=Xenococcus sp. PCC 7305 TaxID=102125 RepID=UPI0002ACEE36|nr:hypothetical protein [Xenococcus sp. PCC 7305]ELS04771.1 hypothetical protein Xen7305DRAFT_00045070 [Xenococcus sp. PCC 7305]
MSYQRKSDRLGRFIEKWLVALILIGVALLQIYLAANFNLTPWKGGGFGMFAAIDSSAMRIIQAEGLDQEGEILTLDLVNALDKKTWRRIRALPRQSDLEAIAPDLLTNSFVPTTIAQQAAYEKLRDEKKLTLQALDQLKPKILDSQAADLLSQPLYRVQSPSDPVVPDVVKTLKAVRLQWWRIRFDAANARLWAEPLSQVVEAGVWP